VDGAKFREGGSREETEFETARENRGVYSVQRAENFVER
jgi:hypothetical protein